MKGKIISLMLLGMLMLSVVGVFSVHALPGNSMWLEPTTLSFTTATTPLGSKFNVTVWLNLTTAANSWQLYLVYDNSQLNATRCDYTGSGKSQWSGTTPINPVAPGFGSFNATHNYIVHGEVLQSSADKTGSGSLSWVEFQMIQAPPEGGRLASELRLDLIGVFKSKALTKTFTSIALTFGKATFSYESQWEPPPPASIYVDPSKIIDMTLRPPQNFTVDVKIGSATNVSFLDFTVTFNATIINAIEATSGGFIPPGSTITIDKPYAGAYVRMNATLSSLKSGAGTLVTIKFQVQDNGTSPIHLTDISLKDDKARDLPFEPSDGSFSNNALPGDANGDGKVEIEDIQIVDRAFGAYPGHPTRWDPRADVAPIGQPDGRIDIFDLAVVEQSYGLYK